MEAPWLTPLLGLAVLAGLMTLLWRRQQRTGNAGWVDLVWSFSIGVLAVAYALGEDGWGPRRALVGVLAGLWSARLSLHLWRRLRGEKEDGRYTTMRERWGESFQRLLFWFYQAQALLAVLLSLGFLSLCSAQQPGWRVVDCLAVALWLAALAGESLADHQLSRWRRDERNRGKTCRLGLWAWSRHPNYFFEWLHWLAYPVLGIGLPWGWTLWAIPTLMLLLVLKVSGIPPTEEQSLKSRGDDYRAYQRETNSFFPGPPRRVSTQTMELS